MFLLTLPFWCVSVRPRCCSLSWGTSEAEQFAAEHGVFDLLLGADVVFWPDAVPLLLQTVHCFLTRTVCHLSYLLTYLSPQCFVAVGWLTEVSNNACPYIGRYGNSNMGTKKNNHTDPICFCCFEKKKRFFTSMERSACASEGISAESCWINLQRFFCEQNCLLAQMLACRSWSDLENNIEQSRVVVIVV